MEINELLDEVEHKYPEFEISYASSAPDKWTFDFGIEVKNTLRPVTVAIPRLTLTLDSTPNGPRYSLIYNKYSRLRNYWYLPKNAAGSYLLKAQCRPNECEDLLSAFDTCYKAAQKVKADVEAKPFAEEEKQLLELGLEHVPSLSQLSYQLTSGFPDKKEIGIILLEQSAIDQAISFYKFYVYDRSLHRTIVNRTYDSFEEMIEDLAKE